jgi:hypothetical protein
MQFWMRIETEDVGCGLDEMLGLTTFKDNARVVMYPRWTVDSRLEAEAQYKFTPTPKQLLYGKRADLKRIQVERDANGRAIRAKARVELVPTYGSKAGYVFSTMRDQNVPLEHGRLYTLDSDPNDWNGSHQSDITTGLVGGRDKHDLRAPRRAARCCCDMARDCIGRASDSSSPGLWRCMRKELRERTNLR